MPFKIYRISLFFFCIFLTACHQQNKNMSKKESEISKNLEATSNTQDIESQINSFKPSIKIHKIDQLTIPIFLDITISQMEQQVFFSRQLLKEGLMNTEESQEDNGTNQKFISLQEKARSDFFNQWGITDNTFAQFGINHSPEIQQYIKTHPDIQDKINTLQNFLTKIQAGSTDDTNDYNTKDADAIVSNTPNS